MAVGLVGLGLKRRKAFRVDFPFSYGAADTARDKLSCRQLGEQGGRSWIISRIPTARFRTYKS
jgi:hypothetical protein